MCRLFCRWVLSHPALSKWGQRAIVRESDWTFAEFTLSNTNSLVRLGSLLDCRVQRSLAACDGWVQVQHAHASSKEHSFRLCICQPVLFILLWTAAKIFHSKALTPPLIGLAISRPVLHKLWTCNDVFVGSLVVSYFAMYMSCQEITIRFNPQIRSL